MEETVPVEVPPQAKKAIAEELLKSQVFDKFMASKFATVKRYGAEGAESMVAFFQELFHLSAKGLLVYKV
jgi:probable 2-oxoglutarate dehydrogenase E1 component DHKTD1